MSWLRNIQGQLSELANEVLSEATEEVADPESELQVAKKKCAGAEKELAVKSAKVESLERKVKELEEEVYHSHAEMDAIGQKYDGIVQDRENEIKQLKIKLEHLSNRASFDDTEHELVDLRKEVAHWKSMVQSESADMLPLSEVEKRLETLRIQKDEEIAVLVEQHSCMMQSMRESFDEKMSSLHELASTSTNDSNLDAVMVDRAELTRKNDDSSSEETHDLEIRLQSAMEDISALENQILELKANNSSLQLENEQKSKDQLTLENLRCQHSELNDAYNDLNAEFEAYKEREQDQRQPDLVDRIAQIDALRANLIEYEERYEMCKRENAETERQLAQLTKDFDALRKTIDDAKKSPSDQHLTEEVDRLRQALEAARTEALQLRSDVDIFRQTVTEFESKLTELKTRNDDLGAENTRLLMDLKLQQENAGQTETARDEQTSAHEHLEQELRDQIMTLKQKNTVLEEQVVLSEKVSELLKEGDAGKTRQMELYEEKTKALELLNAELREKISILESSTTSDEKIQSLTNQLKEALAATSEKTEECEKLRNDLEEQLKEIQVRQSCVDDLIAQNNLLQVQYQQAAESGHEFRNKLKLKDDELEQKQLVVDELKELLLVARTENMELNARGPGSSSEEYSPDYSSVIDAHVKEAQNLRCQVQDLEAQVGSLMKKVAENMAVKEEGEKSVQEQLHNLFDSIRNQYIDEWKAATESHQSIVAGLKAQNEALLVAVASLEEVNTQQSKTIESLSETAAAADACVEKLTEKLNQNKNTSQGDAAKFQEYIKSLEERCEQFTQIVSDKHAESVRYYEQLQGALNASAQQEAKIQELSTSFEKEKTNNEKIVRELSRLKEHLILVEETSTREQIDAERRETELRARLKELQESSCAASEGASENTMNLEMKIQSLLARAESSERSLEEWKARYESSERLRQETSDALSSLQSVVRELSSDHEKGEAMSGVRIAELEKSIESLKNSLSQLQREVEQMSLEKQAAEDNLEVVQSSLEARQKIIYDLEIQLQEVQEKTQKNTENYRVDDVTLRQMFLSYFTSPPDKRSEIALVLASILGYEEGDVNKIKTAISPQQDRTRPNYSLTTQFIRFLENESESGSTAPHLPVTPVRTSLRDDQPQTSGVKERIDDILK